MITALIISVAYVANLYLNRWIFFRLGDLNKSNLNNEAAKFFCFLSLYGTLLLWLIYVTECKWIKTFFTPKKK